MRNAGWEWGGSENEVEMKSHEWKRRSLSGLSVVGWSRRTQVLEEGKQEGLYLLKSASFEPLDGA